MPHEAFHMVDDTQELIFIILETILQELYFKIGHLKYFKINKNSSTALTQMCRHQGLPVISIPSHSPPRVLTNIVP